MGRFRVILGRVEEKPMATGLQSLAEELVQEVLAHLRWPTDFYILCLVSRMFYRHATHELYSTLVIAYHRPERIGALLSLLQTKPERASLVTTLLFDEDVKSIGPNLQDQGKWPPRAHRRELTDGWDPASREIQSPSTYPLNRHHPEIARRLPTILPALGNLKRVVIRSLHPVYMRPAIHEALPDLNRRDASSGATSLDVWEYIFGGSSHIAEIYVNGVTSGFPTERMLSVLTTICISDLFLNTRGHAKLARAWNIVLAQAPRLQKLGMAHVEHAHAVLDGRFFPQLQALELYMVYLTYPNQPGSEAFIEFLYRHSFTLRILALSSPLWAPIDHRRWLKDKSILPELHTLRLGQIGPLLGSAAELVPGSPLCDRDAAFAPAAAIIAEKTEVLIEFVKHRPNILDLGICSLQSPQADEFARFLVATRRMRNVFIGETAKTSFETRVCFRTETAWQYAYEAWSFYELFGGLTITKSGFRPRLPPPPPWKFWKKAVV